MHFVLSALAALPFVVAASVNERSLEARAPTCSTDGPEYGHYTYLGCAHDSAKRICTERGLPIAGVETGQECYCGSSFSNGEGYALPESSCNQEIVGQPAGGSWALSISVAKSQIVSLIDFTTMKEKSPGCVPPAGWQYDSFVWENTPTQCFHDGPKRALTGYSFKSAQMTFQLCTSTCGSKGFSIAGVEVGSECYCGNQFENGEGYAIDSSLCDQPIAGSGIDFGGGKWALSIYKASAISKPINLGISIPAAPKKRSLNFGRNATVV
ncbi:G- protein-coupled receptor [Steccherinum ochraceum]|uniref:G-protein-coupled receptor n=1 Tax=Steccherinum ochraceum TaxID=92696 RepID=A0A4R0RYH3_9APHY|nr:G- protein-coupled receptor [Steccherinum ochraceum]